MLIYQAYQQPLLWWENKNPTPILLFFPPLFSHFEIKKITNGIHITVPWMSLLGIIGFITNSYIIPFFLPHYVLPYLVYMFNQWSLDLNKNKQ